MQNVEGERTEKPGARSGGVSAESRLFSRSRRLSATPKGQEVCTGVGAGEASLQSGLINEQTPTQAPELQSLGIGRPKGAA